MAIKDLVSGAWQDIGTLKVPVSGAYQEATKANALSSGAWQEVWSSKYYFLKDGVVMNGARVDASYGARVDGNSILLTPSRDGGTPSMLLFRLTSDMVGKSIYVRVNANIKEGSGNSSRMLRISYPLGGGVSSGRYASRASTDLLYFSPLTTENVQAPSYYTTLDIDNVWGGYEYRIYDVYLA